MDRPRAIRRASAGGGLRPGLVVVLAIAASACQSMAPDSSPLASMQERPAPSISAAGGPASPAPASPSPAALVPSEERLPMLYELEPGTLAEVVTDDLVLRTAPRIASDSLILPEMLNAPTRVYVRGGPVEADGYAWLLVDALDDRGGQASVWLEDETALWMMSGWAAAAGKDGEQWLAPLGRTAGEWVVTSAAHLEAGADPRNAATGPDGRIYTFGGMLRDGSAIADSNAYDPASGSWQGLAPMPTARSAPSVALVDDRFYVIGGYTAQGPVSTVEIYDPATDEWRVGTPLPEPGAFGSTAAAGPDGSVYLFGRDGIWVHGSAGGAWRLASETAIGAADAVSMDGLIYVLDDYGAIRVFDPEEATLGPLNLPRMIRSGGAMTVMPDSRLLVVGGYWAGGGCIVPPQYEPDVEGYPGAIHPPIAEAFDPTAGTWHTFAHVPAELSPQAVVVAGRRVLMLGTRIDPEEPWRALGGIPETLVAEFVAPGELVADGMEGLPTDDLTARGCGDLL